MIDERAAEPDLAADADQAELGDVADLDAVQRALLVDVELRAAEQIEQLDPAARDRADLEQAALRGDERAHDVGARGSPAAASSR